MLKSLEIKNFRALADFKVNKLGRVNLIVGKNNSGKSTILEALRIYAGGAHSDLLREIAGLHNEAVQVNELANGFDEPLPFEGFFPGRRFPQRTARRPRPPHPRRFAAAPLRACPRALWASPSRPFPGTRGSW